MENKCGVIIVIRYLSQPVDESSCLIHHQPERATLGSTNHRQSRPLTLSELQNQHMTSSAVRDWL